MIAVALINGTKVHEMLGCGERSDLMEMRLNTLKQNALNAGYLEADIEVKWVTDAEYQSIIDNDPDTIEAKAAREALQAAKQQALVDNLPSWTQVDTAINNIANLADAKAFIKKLSRVVYLDLKNSVD